MMTFKNKYVIWTPSDLSILQIRWNYQHIKLTNQMLIMFSNATMDKNRENCLNIVQI